MGEKLWTETELKLKKMIHEMQAGDNKFPPEKVLAKELGVSRATLRDALQNLSKEGYVTPLQGSANYAHPSAFSMRHRIDLDGDFLRLIEKGSGSVLCKTVYAGEGTATETMKKMFPVPCDRTYELVWLYSGDGKPLIYCQTSVPMELVKENPRRSGENEMVSDWIEENCGRTFAYYATHFGAYADERASSYFDLPKDTIMPSWRQVAFDMYDEPVAFCNIFFHPENMDVCMIVRP